MCTIKESPKTLSKDTAWHFWRIGVDGEADIIVHNDRVDDDQDIMEYGVAITEWHKIRFPELNGYHIVFATNEDGTPTAEALTAAAYNKWHMAEFGY